MSVAADHEATVKSRTEELNAIATAEKILKETSGGAVGQSYSLLQLKASADLRNAEVANVIKKLARDHHSTALAQLASRIGAVMRFGAADGADVFGKELVSKQMGRDHCHLPPGQAHPSPSEPPL